MKKSLSLSIMLLAFMGSSIADEVSQKNIDKKTPHPCVSFKDGKTSWSDRTITSLAVAFATKNKQFEHQILLAFFPFFHSIVHHETDNLKDTNISLLANNWTSLGLSGVIYMLSKTYGWSEDKTLGYILRVLYAQGTVAIAASKIIASEEEAYE